jgi:hypothetical protein
MEFVPMHNRDVLDSLNLNADHPNEALFDYFGLNPETEREFNAEDDALHREAAQQSRHEENYRDMQDINMGPEIPCPPDEVPEYLQNELQQVVDHGNSRHLFVGSSSVPVTDQVPGQVPGSYDELGHFPGQLPGHLQLPGHVFLVQMQGSYDQLGSFLPHANPDDVRTWFEHLQQTDGHFVTEVESVNFPCPEHGFYLLQQNKDRRVEVQWAVMPMGQAFEQFTPPSYYKKGVAHASRYPSPALTIFQMAKLVAEVHGLDSNLDNIVAHFYFNKRTSQAMNTVRSMFEYIENIEGGLKNKHWPVSWTVGRWWSAWMIAATKLERDGHLARVYIREDDRNWSSKNKGQQSGRASKKQKKS